VLVHDIVMRGSSGSKSSSSSSSTANKTRSLSLQLRHLLLTPPLGHTLSQLQSVVLPLHGHVLVGPGDGVIELPYVGNLGLVSPADTNFASILEVQGGFVIRGLVSVSCSDWEGQLSQLSQIGGTPLKPSTALAVQLPTTTLDSSECRWNDGTKRRCACTELHAWAVLCWPQQLVLLQGCVNILSSESAGRGAWQTEQRNMPATSCVTKRTHILSTLVVGYFAGSCGSELSARCRLGALLYPRWVQGPRPACGVCPQQLLLVCVTVHTGCIRACSGRRTEPGDKWAVTSS
jgi:hypothetical protein